MHTTNVLPHCTYRDGSLHIDEVGAEDLAERFGTPLYVYSATGIRANFTRLAGAFMALKPTLCYALKACGNVSVCRTLAGLGAGMDVVSGGELERAWLSGVDMSKVVFAGVGKTREEIAAALSGAHSPLKGIVKDGSGRGPEGRGAVGMFNIESEGELRRIARIAEDLKVEARACIRVNPDVDAHTHKYTTTGKSENKFGIAIARAKEVIEAARAHAYLKVRGVHVHLGSPIATPKPYMEAIAVVLAMMDELNAKGAELDTLNIGGGYGIDYGLSTPATPEEFAAGIVPLLAGRVAYGLRVFMEPGRCIVGNTGVLLTRVQYVKIGDKKRFVVCDAGMHTLIRPALYQAHHFVWPARTQSPPTRLAPPENAAGLVGTDVVGPLCESSDFLCQDRPLPVVEEGAVLAVFCAGAYGMSMASTYNDHPKPAEVLVDGTQVTLIRPRQELHELVASELAAVGVA